MLHRTWIALAASAALVVGCSPPPPADGGADVVGGDMAAPSDTGGGGTDATLDAPLGDSPPAGDAMVCTPPDDAGPMGLPNLRADLMDSRITVGSFSATSCEWNERCIEAPGTRRLLRFTLRTPNEGPGDLYLGSPTAANRPAGMFEFSTCHNHWHLLGYAEYTLQDASGNVVARGHKQSFCLEDFASGVASPYTCSNQGIHAGSYDVYDASLPCQWIDITDVPAGHYRIVARINTHCVIPENNYSDDTGVLEVDIPPLPDGGLMAGDPLAACTMGETGPERDCGWRVEGTTMTCTPGAMVTVGCGMGTPACPTPHGGTCVGDPVMRICPGAGACTAGGAIAQNDDACGGMDSGNANVCPQVTFPCPATGSYTILTGAYTAGTAYTCAAGP